MAGKVNVPATVYGPGTVPEAEFIGTGKGWVGQGSAAHGEGMALVHTFHCPWPQRFTHIRETLGYSTRDQGTISRKLPRPHPHAGWLRATRLVSYEGVKWNGKSGSPVGGELSDYEIARLTYSFTTLPYDLKEDAEVRGPGKGEWQRFTVLNQKPAGELITRQGFEWRYVDTPMPPGTAKFPGSTGVPLMKKRLAWRWCQVPERYLMDANGVPTKLDAGLNTINSVAFAGYEAETLLFESYEIEARMEPVPGSNFEPGTVPRSYDVTLFLVRFKPPKGGAKEGWNNDVASDNKWYQTHAFTPAGVDSGNAKFITYDFKQLFDAA